MNGASIDNLANNIDIILDSGSTLTNQDVDLLQENLNGLKNYEYKNPEEQTQVSLAYMDALYKIEEKDSLLLTKIKL